jgi:GT2 family glycosyltransferase
VLIPTLDRLPVLQRTLATLGSQELDGIDAEVVVVDNGSGDGTLEWLCAEASGFPAPLTALSEPRGGAAAARNAGLAAATGRLILLLGDDVRPGDPDFLAGHVRAHEGSAERLGVLGRIAWDPEREITPVMRWLDKTGKQFDYAAPAGGAVGPEHFYSSNLSLPRKLLLEVNGFDERFTKATWEDYDIGLRLVERGFELRYAPNLIAYHDHHYDLGASLARMRWVGTSARLLEELHPGRDDLATPHPTGLKGAIGRALAPLAARLPVPDWLPRPLRSFLYRCTHFTAVARGYAEQIEAGA